MIISGIVVLLLTVGVLVTTKVTVQKGKVPTGRRLNVIKESVNYQEPFFQNVEDTNMDKPPIEGIKEMMKKGTDRAPEKSLNTLPIDLGMFENATSNETLICWLGHSTFLVKTGGINILVDPVFSKRASVLQWVGPKRFDYSCTYSLDDLPEIDLVLISHDHYDHLDCAAIKGLKDKVDAFYMPLGVGAHLEHWKVDPLKIHELDWWDSFEFKGVKFTATPGRHFTGRFLNDRFKTLWCGWAIKSANHNVYYSGDTGYFNGFSEIGERLGPFDFALMECGQYSKYWANIHMFPEESANAAVEVKSKLAMPIHWGKFKLSIHAWYESPQRFLKQAEQNKLEVALPEIGEVFSIEKAPQKEWWINQ